MNANRYPGNCTQCGAQVAPGSGFCERVERKRRRPFFLVWCKEHGEAHDAAMAQRERDRQPDRFDMAYEDRCAEACGFSPFGGPDQ